MLTRWLLKDRKRWVAFLSLALLAVSYGIWRGYQSRVMEERAMHWWTYPPKFRVTNRHYDERRLYGLMDKEDYEGEDASITYLNCALHDGPVVCVWTGWLDNMTPEQRIAYAASRKGDILSQCRARRQDALSLERALDMVASRYAHPTEILIHGDIRKLSMPTIAVRVEFAYYKGRRSWIIICQGSPWNDGGWSQFVIPVSLDGEDLSPTWRR